MELRPGETDLEGPTRIDVRLNSLVSEARSGAKGAFEKLARRVHPQIHRWALARTGDVQDADDVAQEALVRMYRSLPGYDGRAAFSSWLYQVTRSAAADLHRVQNRQRRLCRALEKEHSNPGSDRGVIDPIDDTDTSRDWVMTYLNELSARQREVFDLCDLQGLSPVAAAQLLGLEPSTIRVHLMRARALVRRKILQNDTELVTEHDRSM